MNLNGGMLRAPLLRMSAMSSSRIPIVTSSAPRVDLKFSTGVYNPFRFGREMFYAGVSFQDRWDRIVRDLSILGRVSTGTTVVSYNDSGDAFHQMWAAIDEAKKSVLWQTYICKDDFVGRVTVAKMEAAHSRGCRTELLYDCGGNITGRRRLVDRLRQCGATVIKHRPFFSHFWRYVLGGMQWERSPALRNHRKILIVDSRIGFCGGLNIGNEYCGKSEGGSGRFRDTQCAVVGPAVAHLQEVYNDTKAPQPWKWSFSRWRQIASATMSRRYREGMNARDRLLNPVTRTVRRRGSIYLRRQIERAEHGTAMLRSHLRSSPQRERLERFERAMRNYSHRLEEQLQQQGDVVGSVGRSRIGAALYRRMQARLLLSVPILDTESVPGAARYSQTRPVLTQVISCNPHTRDWSIPYAFWRVAKRAQRRLWVTTPYYLPHRKLMRALLHAARCGVDVRILAGSSTTTDPWFMWYASNYITERLLAAGVRVYEYKGSEVMHAKTVVVDSIWSSVGSYNWDMMSNKNMEVCVCHLSYDFAREMETQFLSDLEKSVEVRYEEHRQRSWRLRLLSCFFYYGLHIAERMTFRTFSDADLSSKLSDVK